MPTASRPWLAGTLRSVDYLMVCMMPVLLAHTLSIVKNADQILVVSGGKIAESGTHDELMAKRRKYAAMWNAEDRQAYRPFPANKYH